MVFALGADHPKQEVSASGWPEGMSELVNSPERIHGYFVNSEDVFYFVGNQKQFNQALKNYAEIDGVVQHKIIVHDGVGRAKSPWQKDEGVKCDWKIYGCPASWIGKDPNVKGFILEFHIWKDGKIKIDEDKLPKGILVERVEDAEQDGAKQPATGQDSKSEGKEEPKPEPEGRSQ
ncbi:MAG: hypothetical protein ACSHX9_13645 [Luteolibacter sp.]